MKLDQTVLQKLRMPIAQVWDYIGYDAEPIVGDDNAAAIELCVDAGRLTEIARNPEADQLIQDLCKDNDVDDVYGFLASNIRLV